MFTSHTALVISSIFGIVIVFSFSNLGIEKAIDLFKRLKD